MRVSGHLLASWNSHSVAMLGAPGLVTSPLYVFCVSPALWNADLVAMLGAPGLMSSLGLRVCLYLRVSGAVEAGWLGLA